jgi:hypothetical protein
LDEIAAAMLQQFLYFAVKAVPAGDEHRHIRIQLPYPLEGLAAVYPGHDIIKQHKVNFIALRPYYIHRILAAFNSHNLIADILQNPAAHHNEDFLVIDQQDPAMSRFCRFVLQNPYVLPEAKTGIQIDQRRILLVSRPLE